MSDEKLCDHCQTPIAVRNLSGFCDHLYYPEACSVCEERIRGKPCTVCGGTGRQPKEGLA